MPQDKIQPQERVRLYADLDIAIDTALRVECARRRISRKKFLEDAILREISYVSGAQTREDLQAGRLKKKG